MQFTIERSALLKALGHVQSVVERRNTIPILSNVLLSAEPGQVSFSATDLDMEMVDTAEATVQVPGQITRDGELVINAQRFRSQLRNREDALQRLAELVKNARSAPKPRIATAPTAAAKRQRRDDKRRDGALKQLRRKPELEG